MTCQAVKEGRKQPITIGMSQDSTTAGRRPEANPAQALVVEALTRVSSSVAGGAGAVLLATTPLTGRVDYGALGALGIALMVIGQVQMRRGRHRPLQLLLVASVGWAAIAPIAGDAIGVAALPALALFAFLAVFALPRKTALRFAAWCGAAGVWAVPWVFPGMSPAELAVAAILLGAVGVAGWRTLSLAADILIREEEKYRLLFDSSPVAMFEEDFTDVAAWLESLRRSGVDDIRAHLEERPDQIRKGASLIRIARANPAAARMTESPTPESVPERLVIRENTELRGFIDQFAAVWERRRDVAFDLEGMTSRGRPLEGVVHWSVPAGEDGYDLSRVIVTISDITPRKVVEERLTRTLESNERLLSFEQALVSCSRALLLGTGDDALQLALRTLREAIGADRAYLAVNTDDPDLGASFRVLYSTSRPNLSDEDWPGRVSAWRERPEAHRRLSTGGNYCQVVTEGGADQEWECSLLLVPIFSGDRWTGTIGFADIERDTAWSDDAVRMLEVAAPMLGTFWEREKTRYRLEELVKSKDRFLSTVSHELRTPLTAVLGFAEELSIHASSFQPDELTEILQLIADQSQDMTDMVEDLLVAARADIGTVSIHPQDVYLRSQAEAVLAGIGSTDLSSVRVVGAAGKAWADRTRTRQIIRNLLTNASRYGGDEVVVEAFSDGGRTTLTVRDNGPGIPEPDRERIFEPYERAHDQPTLPGSMGLGLTVSRQLARLMGGDLLYRADESGSAFELTLPAGPPSPSAQAREMLAVGGPTG